MDRPSPPICKLQAIKLTILMARKWLIENGFGWMIDRRIIGKMSFYANPLAACQHFGRANKLEWANVIFTPRSSRDDDFLDGPIFATFGSEVSSMNHP